VASSQAGPVVAWGWAVDGGGIVLSIPFEIWG
jgi:hypothetical protein